MSSENKFSLLASLTSSLPTTEGTVESETMAPNQILSSNEGSRTDDDVDVDSDNSNGEVVFMQDDDPILRDPTSKSNSSHLLTASGLLTGSGFGGLGMGGGIGGGEGGGLFDQVDREEEEKERLALEAERNAKLAADAKRQLELEQRRAQEARESMERELKEEQLRQQQEQQMAAAAAAAEANTRNMQDLSLQDPLSSQAHSYPHVMGGAPTTTTINSMPHQAPTYSNASPMLPSNTTPHPNAYPPHHQQQMQQQPTNTPNQHVLAPTQQHQQLQQPPPPQPSIQQAGFGGSYYYSTSGNVQQQKFNSNANNMNVGVVDPTDPGQSPGVNHYDTSKFVDPSNGNGNSHGNGNAPSIPNSVSSTTSSYAQRSQLRQVNSPHRIMPANPPPPPNHHGQDFSNPQQQQQQQQLQHPSPPIPPDVTHDLQPALFQHYDPSTFKPVHGVITITDPILVQSPGVFSGPPYWTYAVTVRDLNVVEGQEEYSKVVHSVRRRFRHFVALEERLRTDRPGSILPPRPDKHTARAINEATAHQSPQFALQRSAELESYLNALRLHPYAGTSPVLSLFLTLPDHLGVAWPEVSASIFTRLSEVGANTAVKVAEGTSAVLAEMNHEHSIMAGEDNSELLVLATSEGIRIGSVLQAIPKIEGGIATFINLATHMSSNGLELQKLVNQIFLNEKEVAAPLEILANGFLRSARRTGRLGVELAAANQVFQSQYKLCKYERLAFADRRSALARRREARKEADIKARKLAAHQHTMQIGTGRYLNASARGGTSYGQPNMGGTPYGQPNMGGTPYGQPNMGGGGMGSYPMTDKVEMEAAVTDEFAVEAVQDADVVGRTLQNEVERIASLRRTEWSTNLRIMVSSMREAHAERVAIWEGCKTAFENEFPLSGDHQIEYHEGEHPTSLPEPETNAGGMTPIAEDYRQPDFQNEQQHTLTQTVS